MMEENSLELRPVVNLCNESFYIPNYQRGYRWTERQVTDLLEDVFSFVDESSGNTKNFYCLQPIVVSPRVDGSWELIDGQQRLTTLYLIMSWFNQRLIADEQHRLFSLTYESREASEDYLRKPTEQRKDDNIDFAHIYENYQVISKWFADKRNHARKLEDAFLNQVKVIWYETAASGQAAAIDGSTTHAHSIEVFSRLNMGKIPLTGAELVKALLLRSRNFTEGDGANLSFEQVRIAQEWDDIERRLHEDEFWFFMANEPRSYDRIDFILRLRASGFAGVKDFLADPSYTFLAFNEHFRKSGISARKEWEEIKRWFMMVDEWFRDRYFYHVIGFLISYGESIEDISALSKESGTKSAFKKALKGRILEKLFGAAPRSHASALPSSRARIQEEVSELEYGQRQRVRGVLLLFNIASLLASTASNTRFPFDLFKKEQWDIEHIRSVTSDMPERPDAQKAWLRNVINYLQGRIEAMPGDADAEHDIARRTEDSEIYNEIHALVDSEKHDAEKAQRLFDRIIERYDPGSTSDTADYIGNLTLLDKGTNRSYKNAIFPIKRKRLIDLDKSGTFVPLCTKNVFLKYYSRNISEMFAWSGQDMDAYQNAIVETLVHFFDQQEALNG